MYSLPGAGAAAGATALALNWQSKLVELVIGPLLFPLSDSVPVPSRSAAPIRSLPIRARFHNKGTYAHTAYMRLALPHPGHWQLPSYRRRAAGIAAAAGQPKRCCSAAVVLRVRAKQPALPIKPPSAVVFPPDSVSELAGSTFTGEVGGEEAHRNVPLKKEVMTVAAAISADHLEAVPR